MLFSVTPQLLLSFLNPLSSSAPQPPQRISKTVVKKCGAHVAVGIEGSKKTSNGKVIIFKEFNKDTKQMTKVQELTTGPLPDNIAFTADCKVDVATD